MPSGARVTRTPRLGAMASTSFIRASTPASTASAIDAHEMMMNLVLLSKDHKLTVDTSPKALCLWRLPRGIYSARTTLHIPTGNMNVARLA